ncbi:hypothetical protein QTP70_004972 [Hemibagrus guttatus]|uniref:Integrase catalytic domain-containing protein n=1 Tax=Hemibagrus guttatus TaxID=175788 RepID=A0AAE0QHT0_9TELE|nr:hypothetical protein QTP70_004972 [Hemibagrus guttatus]
MDQSKVQAVTGWPEPTTKLLCSTQARQAFARLKQSFTTAPILRHPDPDLPFVVELDTFSSCGVGAVLSQRYGTPSKLHPCAFYSRKLTSAEANYDVGNKELLSIKAALEEWRHWLEGARHPFLVLTNHRNLEYLKGAKQLNSCQTRWALFFTSFNFSVTYRRGSKNGKADALSQQFEAVPPPPHPDPILPQAAILSPVRWNLMEEIQQAHAEEPPPANCPPDRVYVPSRYHHRVMQWIHESLSTGQPGVHRSSQLLRCRFWWSTLRCDFEDFVKSSGGFMTVMVVIDRFSKACKLVPMKELPTILQTADALFQHIFRNFSLPEDIILDRGSHFTSEVWGAFCKQLGISVSLSSGYHPQSNGQAVRLNQEIGRFLRAYCSRKQQHWSEFLPWAEYAQNSLTHSSTGLTPVVRGALRRGSSGRLVSVQSGGLPVRSQGDAQSDNTVMDNITVRQGETVFLRSCFQLLPVQGRHSGPTGPHNNLANVLRQMPFLTQPSHFSRLGTGTESSGWGLGIGWELNLGLPHDRQETYH